MISIEQFVTLLEERELLSPREVVKIRERIATTPTQFTAKTLAKQLIKHGHITPSQAKRLLVSGAETEIATPAASKPPVKNDD